MISRIAGLAALVGACGWVGMASAQEETMGPPGTTAGSAWRVFTKSDQTHYLIDMSSIAQQGDEARARIARIPKASEAGEFAHVVDEFGVRCASGEARVITSSDVGPDGETADTYPADEPWTHAPAGSFDEAVKDIVCGTMVPSGAPFASIRAYMEAGRP